MDSCFQKCLPIDLTDSSNHENVRLRSDFYQPVISIQLNLDQPNEEKFFLTATNQYIYGEYCR